MPVVPLQCPLCTGLIQIDISLAGQQVVCPLCQGMLALPPAEFFAGMGLPEPPQPQLPPPGELLPLVCPVCSGPFQVAVQYAGQQVGCPHCASPIAIPPLERPAEPDAKDLLPPGAEPPTSAPRSEPPLRERLPPARPEPRVSLADRLPPGAAPAVVPLAPAETAASAHAAAVETAAEPVESLLPPGALDQAAAPPAVDEAQEARGQRPRRVVDLLLPQGADDAAAAVPGERVPIPAPSARAPLRPKNLPAGGVALPTPDGGFTTLVDSPRKIRDGNEDIEVRRLTADEKSRRRFRRNLVLWAVCLVILVIVFVVMR